LLPDYLKYKKNGKVCALAYGNCRDRRLDYCTEDAQAKFWKCYNTILDPKCQEKDDEKKFVEAVFKFSKDSSFCGARHYFAPNNRLLL
jgi:hypothetical protein